jgi:U11/U12 small nuclear ribonucleoprotein SNRNP48
LTFSVNLLGIKKEVPFSNDRSLIELSAQQRLALYDYVIGRNDSKCSDFSRSDQSLNVDLFDAFNKNESQTDYQKETSNKLQILAMQRDLKRRRQSYRAKSVHIRGKSYSEILRNVIENHCQSLKSQFETNPDRNSTSSTSHSHKHKTHKHKSKHKSKDRHKHKHHKRHKH